LYGENIKPVFMVATSKKKKIFDGRFEIVGIVGRGSQSVVYHAQNATNPNNQVALKVLVNHGKTKSNQEINERLRKEALAMVAARHRYVIRIEDFHSLDSLCYLSMEYAPEGDLRRYVSTRNGKLPALQAERLFMQIVEALCAVHKSGIIHRDIKPDNILVLDDQEVRLGDFGTAILPGDESSIEELKKGVGTFSYMAPEVLEGIEYSESADLYSLGVTFYEILTGKHPFEGVPLMKQLTVRQNGNITPINKLVPNISPNFATAITKCLSYNKIDRPKSADDLLEFMISGKGDLGKKTAMPAKPLANKVEVVKEKSLPPPPPVYSSEYISAEASMETQAMSGFSAPVKRSSALVKTPQETRSPTQSLAMGTAELQVERPVVNNSNFQSPLSRMMAESNHAANLIAGHQQINSSPVPNQLSEKPEDLQDETPFVPTQSKSLARELIANSSKKSGKKGTLASSKIEEPKSKRIPTQIIVFGLLFLAALGWQFMPGQETSKRKLVSAIKETDETTQESFESPISDEALIPEASAEQSLFPFLGAGMYHGEISGLYPNSHHSLTLISFPEASKIAVIVGIEGWVPAVISTEGLNAGDSISVAANGFVLKFTGQVVDGGEVVGFFKNVINNSQGEWRVQQLSKSEEDK
jgi:serine/threonine-protein kinase